MSQKKVEQYKEYKKNRDEILKKEKQKGKTRMIIAIVIAAVFIGWFGYSIYNSATRPAEGESAQMDPVVWNVEDYQEYTDGLPSEY